MCKNIEYYTPFLFFTLKTKYPNNKLSLLKLEPKKEIKCPDCGKDLPMRYKFYSEEAIHEIHVYDDEKVSNLDNRIAG